MKELKDSLNELYIQEQTSKEEYNMIVFQEGIISKLKNMFNNKSNNSKKFIGKECYECSQYKLKIGSTDCYVTHIMNKSEAITDCLITDIKAGTKDKDKLYINKKYEKELDSKILYLYKVEIIDVLDNGAMNCKILEVEELTLRQALNHVNYEFKDNSSATNKRKQIFSKVCNITKKVFNEIGKEKLNGGFWISNYKDKYELDEIEEFFNCIIDYFYIFEYDAWDFTNNKARDDYEYEKFSKVLYEIMDNIKAELDKNNIKGSIDIYGDWDDGPVAFIYKE